MIICCDRNSDFSFLFLLVLLFFVFFFRRAPNGRRGEAGAGNRNILGIIISCITEDHGVLLLLLLLMVVALLQAFHSFLGICRVGKELWRFGDDFHIHKFLQLWSSGGLTAECQSLTSGKRRIPAPCRRHPSCQCAGWLERTLLGTNGM